MSTPQIPKSLEHYLRVGCWRGAADGRPNLDLFLLHGAVLGNRLDGLRKAWTEWSWAVKREPRAGEAFAAMALRVGDWRKWQQGFGRLACPEHNRE
jgi:hypothetical protein